MCRRLVAYRARSAPRNERGARFSPAPDTVYDGMPARRGTWEFRSGVFNMNHSGPLGIGSGGLGKTDRPPNLAQFSNDPIYDLVTIVQLVGVRPRILWSWEQQLGIPAPARLTDEASGNVRRYSERDLIASLWLREQILNG